MGVARKDIFWRFKNNEHIPDNRFIQKDSNQDFAAQERDFDRCGICENLSV